MLGSPTGLMDGVQQLTDDQVKVGGRRIERRQRAKVAEGEAAAEQGLSKDYERRIAQLLNY